MIKALFALSLALASPAAAICFEPTEPYCIRAIGTFEDQFAYNSCLSQMEGFQADTVSYQACRQDEARQAIEEANRDISNTSDTLNDAVEYWNCKASGNSFCM